MAKSRRSFEPGHHRKFLVIVDESPEVEAALFFAASRATHATGDNGQIKLLYVIEPQGYQHWVGVRQVQLEEETNKARALFRMFRRKLDKEGFADVATEEDIREGNKVDVILNVIDEDEDVAVLLLGASVDAKGPGPLVSSLAAGKAAGSFPIPITIVPGTLQIDDIKKMA